MGVFARLLRKSKATEEASTAEVRTGPRGAGAEAEAVEEAKASSETGDPATAEKPAATAAEEDVEIPQQQTADKAADNEAGEGARK
ncbi:hypothetical protein [Streptomyces sp. 142MFCol3.1]|uniref:hypothetical protein n=1 Tax=Streptomyces sp. 142MFCol3.1 TaxID=1172179 RepID=UPI00042A53C0|nr:hypothetical protein [Streptomyces sp. 142MFCol3.1]